MNREKLFSVTKKDLRVDTFRAGGKGGQNQNKRDTGVRITHLDSGAVGISRKHRTQEQNKREAFTRMREDPRWMIWFNRRVYETLSNKTIEERVEEMMKDVTVEYREDGKWTNAPT